MSSLLRQQHLRLPLLDGPLVELVPVLVAGAALVLLVQLLLDTLPLLHQRRHLSLGLFRLKKNKKNAEETQLNNTT